MKKQVRFLLLLAALLVPWVTQAQLPTSINCTFENDSDSAGWVFANGGATNKWCIGSAAANGGTKSLYISNTNGTTNAYDATSSCEVYAYTEVALTAGTYNLSFDWQAYGESCCDYLRVYLVPSNTTITAGSTPASSWLNLGDSDGKFNVRSSWQNHFIEFVSSSTGNYKLVFNWHNDGSVGTMPPAAVDNIVLFQPSCPRPAVTNLRPTADSAYFSWAASADNYLLEYADSAFTPLSGQATAIYTSDNEYALDGLTPSTTYYYALTAFCGDGDTSMTRSGTFQTRCAPISIPYAYGFETTDTLGGYWYYGRAGNSPNTSYPNPNSTSTPFAGSRNLYTYNYYYDNNKYWAAMPLLDASLSEVMLSFYMRTAYTSTTTAYPPIKVGYMTNVEDPSTFVTIYSRNLNSTTWTKDFVTFPDSISYPSGASIAFMFDGSGSTSSQYYNLDNIEVTEIPTCPLVENIEATTGVGSAILTWEYNANTGIEEPTEYEISYVPVDDTTATPIVENSSETSIAIYGLTANVAYKAWVAPLCSDGSTGGTDSIIFTTTNMPCLIFDTTGATMGDSNMIVGNGTSADYSCLFPNIWYHRYQQIIYKASEIGGPGQFQAIGFERRDGDASSISVVFNAEIYMAHVPNSSLASGYIPYNALTFKHVRSGAMPISGSGWMKYELDEEFSYNGTDNLLIVIASSVSSYNSSMYFKYTNVPNSVRYSQSDGSAFNPTATQSGGSAYAMRPNIRFYNAGCEEYGNCARPLLTVTNVSDTGAHLAWEPGYQETEWDVFYRRNGAEAWSLLVAGTTNTSIDFNGLQGGTAYEVAVMGICEDSLMATESFSTECGPIYRHTLPYIMDITTQTTTGSGTEPSCWTRPSGTNSTYPYINNSTISGRGPYLYWYAYTSNTNGMLVLPESEMAVDSLEIYIDLYKSSSSYSGKLVIGVMEDPDDISTFEPVDTLHLPIVSNWVTLHADLNNYVGTGKYIALFQDKTLTIPGYTSDYIYMSKIEVARRTACRPLAVAYVSNITSGSADINIQDHDNTDAANYIVYYSTTNDVNGADSLLFTGTSATITGLLPSTTYYAWVGARCSADNSRLRSIVFQTQPSCLGVENLTVSASAVNNTAVLSWDAPAEASPVSYVVSYQTENDTTVWTSDTTTNTYYTISGLTIDVDYRYKVTTLCSQHVSPDNSGSFTLHDPCIYVGSMNGTQSYVPFYCYYNYGYNQSLYLASEMRYMGDTIYGIYYTQTSATAVEMDITLDIYLGNTDQASFASTANYIPADSLTQVATNHVMSMNGAGMYYIPFSTPFVRDVNRNLVIAIDNNTGSYSSPAQVWASTATSTNRSIYMFQDDSDVTPQSPGASNTGLGAWIPDVLFNASCASTVTCGNPMLVSTGNTATTIDVRWFAGGSETAWTVDYRLEGVDTWTNFLTNTTQTTTTITGLNSGLLYEVRVSHLCSGDTFSVSNFFSTACGAIALPYVENFNASANARYARNCWHVGAENNVWPTVNNYVNFGKMVLIDDGAFLAAPVFNVPVNQLQVNVMHWGTQPGTFIYVGVITDIASAQTFIPVDTLYCWNELIQANTTVHFNNYTGPEGRICFYVPTGYPILGQHFIKNLIFDLNSNCPTVDSIWMTSLSSSDATVAWSTDNIGTAASYLVEYDTAGFIPGTGNVLSVSGASATLSNLMLSTVYDVYVTPICSNGDTMYRSAVYRIQTDCDVFALPYHMNFDLPYLPALTATHTMPPCWNYEMLANGTSPTTYYDPQIYSSTSYASSGRYVLYTYYKAVMALPDFNTPVDTLQVSFHAYGSSSYYELVVGVVDSTTPGFAASFTPIDTINCYNGGAGVYDTVYFCGYNGAGRHIAFLNQYANSTSSYSYIYLDDVVVDYRPACMPVSNIRRTAVGTSMLTLQWDACGTAPIEYEVEYGEEGFTQGTGITRTTNTNSITITGLATESPYDVYIRTNCGADGYSNWVFYATETAMCDNMSDNMVYDTNANQTTTSYIPGYSLYNYSYSQVVYDSTMLADAGWSEGSMIVGFAFHPTNVSGNTHFNNCRVFLKHTDRTEFTSTMSDYDSVDASNLVYTGDLNWTATGWRQVEFDSAFVWDGHSNVLIAIDRDNGSYSGNGSFLAYSGSVYRSIYQYSDGTNINPLTHSGSMSTRTTTTPIYRFTVCGGNICGMPGVTVATTYNEGTLNWTSSATSFEVNVKAVADANWPTDIAVNNAYTYTATGLLPATEYMYRVRARCEDGAQSEWAEGRFITDSLPCFAPSNLTATPTLGNAEINWTNGGNETEWNIHVWNTAFDQTFNVTGNPATVTGLTPGTEYYAAIQAVCGGGMVISDYGDTISFTTDVCDPVTNVTATVEGSTATVTWTAGDNNTGQFAIEYGYEGFAAGTGTTLTATSNSITITDLESETSYDVYVRAICEGQYNSVWSDPASFETAIGIDAVNGNNAVTIYPNPAEQSTTIRVNGVEGIVSVTIVDMTGRTVSTSSLECSGDCENLMNVTDLAAGSYFVRLQGNGLDTVKKLVIK